MWEIKIVSERTQYDIALKVNEYCEQGWEPVGFTRTLSGLYDSYEVMLRRKKVLNG